MKNIFNFQTILYTLLTALLISGCTMVVEEPDQATDHGMAGDHAPASGMNNSSSLETTLDDVNHGPLLLQNVWGRPSFTGSMGAIYMNLTNSGEVADRLVSASTEVAAVVEIHEVIMENDVMEMKLLPNGLPLPMGEQIDLKPGGYHIMLFDLQQDLNVGDIYSVTLEFEESGTVDVPVEVLMP